MRTKTFCLFGCLLVLSGCGKQTPPPSDPAVEDSIAATQPEETTQPAEKKQPSASPASLGDKTPDWIEAIGGRARFEKGVLTQLDLRDCEFSDEHFAPIGKLTGLKVLKLNGKHPKTNVTPESFAALSTLTGLKVLALDLLPVTDTGLAKLSPLKNLVELYLAKTNLGDQASDTITGFAKLKKLRLAGNPISAEHYEPLGKLVELIELDVSECEQFNDTSTSMLEKLTKLQKINLWRTGITDKACPILGKCSTLTSLNVDATKVGDEGLKSIGKMSQLTFLHLGSTQITDEGLEAITGLKRLERLIVTRTAVTQAGVDQLQPQLPDTEIQLKFEP